MYGGTALVAMLVEAEQHSANIGAEFFISTAQDTLVGTILVSSSNKNTITAH